MKKRELISCIIMTAIIVAFMAAAPGYILTSRQPLTQQRRREQPGGYTGVITLWHIAGFKPYSGSIGSWLSKEAAITEKKNPGVFFEVESISPEEYASRMERGERADAYSFPAGWFYPEELSPLEGFTLPDMRGSMSRCGLYGERLYAVPYCASGYVLMYNIRMMQEKGLSEDTISNAIKDGTAVSGDAVTACMHGAKDFDEDGESFIKEKTIAGFADSRGAGDMERKLRDGKGFPYGISYVSGYTDLVQLIGIGIQTDSAKFDAVYQLMEQLLSDNAQKQLDEMGLIGAAVIDELPAPDGDIQAVNRQISADIAVPNTFSYKTCRDELYDTALFALRGSESAKKDLMSRMNLLIGAE